MKIVAPALSPVLEDRVTPPSFRSSIPDYLEESPASKIPIVQDRGTEGRENSSKRRNTGVCARVVRNLFHCCRSSQGGVGKVQSQRKSIDVQIFQGKELKSSRKHAGFHRIDPKPLLTKIRDTYIHMMNNVAASSVVVGANYDLSYTNPSATHSAREFDEEAIAKLVELELSRSKLEIEFQQNSAFSRNSSKVKPYGVGRSCSNTGGSPMLLRNSSKRFADDYYFSRNGSRRKSRENPYADNNWKSDLAVHETEAVSNSGCHHDVQIQQDQGQTLDYETEYWSAEEEPSSFSSKT
uniref:Uncharacterized protein n=1 Tax=Physcomitrium patens TaxID=3218 RepID=A9RXS3_PHYPA|nr:hypothetical protein PHYPA_018863 [Physcomitrium patens]